jgi:hypothetical protein
MGETGRPRFRLQTDTGWHAYWAKRLNGALCRQRQDLPFTADEEPDAAHLAAMRDVCLACPVRIACAELALDRDAPALGGFYAGIWIPWKTDKTARRAKVTWQDARWALRRRHRSWIEAEVAVFVAGQRQEAANG